MPQRLTNHAIGVANDARAETDHTVRLQEWLQIWAVSEEAGIDDGVREARKRGEHPIDKPKLARHKRRVLGPSEPLLKPDDPPTYNRFNDGKTDRQGRFWVRKYGR